MAFESLSSRLQMALRRVTGRGKLNEKDIDLMLREIRLGLLEADVNLKVIRGFLANVKEQAFGERILKGLNPGQQVVKVVRDELTKAMGEKTVGLAYNPTGQTVFMVAGLQGTGKTTAIAKLGKFIESEKDNKRKVMFIAADVYRPAAIEQLKTLGHQTNIYVYEEGQKQATDIVKRGLKYASENKYDVVIIDTAGRLQIDEEMMQELKDIKEIAKPDEILLTVDAMTGQVAADVGLTFHQELGCTGVIMTKLDGDTRGGAALSIRYIAGIPIKLASSGEKLDSLEIFHPDRMAQRILGMGDVLTLIEEAEEKFSERDAMKLMEKMLTGKYNYDDMLKQFKMIRRMGSLSRILGFIPGLGSLRKQMQNMDEKEVFKAESIIFSMTKDERKEPSLIAKSARRRQRIARGSGVKVSDVNKVIDSLNQQQDMVRQVAQNPNMQPSMPQAKNRRSKGKGKGKGRFRF